MDAPVVIWWSGIVFLSWLFFRALYFFYRFFRLFVWSRWCKQIDLRRYGKWAVITGCTDGIGKAYTMELAKRGMDIVLISRNESKLANTATEIEKLYGVKTHCITADFSKRECYSNIKTELHNLDVGILVNNVGILEFSSQEFEKIEENFLWNEIDVNCGAVTIMTKIVLPKMKKKRNGLIVNMGSLSSMTSFPTMGLYASTKAFMHMFSLSIAVEVEPYNIRVQHLMPYFIETNLHAAEEDILKDLKKKATFMIPDAKEFSRSAVYTLNTNYFNHTGYWSHSIMELIAGTLPLKMRVKMSYNFIKSLFKKRN